MTACSVYRQAVRKGGEQMIERIIRIRPLWPRVEAESPAEKGKRRKTPASPVLKSKRLQKKDGDEGETGPPAHVDVRV